LFEALTLEYYHQQSASTNSQCGAVQPARRNERKKFALQNPECA
jgi:hypothetical protein